MLDQTNLSVLAVAPGLNTLFVTFDKGTGQLWLVRGQILDGETDWQPLPGELWSQGPIGWDQPWAMDETWEPVSYSHYVRSFDEVNWVGWLGRVPLVWFADMATFKVPRLQEDDAERSFIFYGRDPRYQLEVSKKNPGVRRWQLVFKDPGSKNDDFSKFSREHIKDIVGVEPLGDGFTNPIKVTLDNGVEIAMKQSPADMMFLTRATRLPWGSGYDTYQGSSHYPFGDFADVMDIAGFKSTLELAKAMNEYFDAFGTYSLPLKTISSTEEFAKLWPGLAEEVFRKYNWEKFKEVPVTISPFIDLEHGESLPLSMFGDDMFAIDRLNFAASKHITAGVLLGPPDRHPGNRLIIPVSDDKGEVINSLPMEMDFDFIPGQGAGHREDTGALSWLTHAQATNYDLDIERILRQMTNDVGRAWWRIQAPNVQPRKEDIPESFAEIRSTVDDLMMSSYKDPVDYLMYSEVLGMLDAFNKVPKIRAVAADRGHKTIVDYMDLFHHEFLLNEGYSPFGRAAYEWWPEIKKELHKAGV